MQSLYALSLAPDANDWLVDSCQPRVLHVFDRVCNLNNERREVLSIVTSEIGNGPFNLVVGSEVVFTEYLHAQSHIFIHADRLHLGDLIVNLTGAELWFPRPDWETLHTRREEILTQLSSVSMPESQFPDSLPISLVNVDMLSSVTAARRLAGLGVGLTPAGDDFIMGAILAARIIHTPEIAQSLAGEIARTVAPLTTSLSAAWLRYAAKGEAGVLWHEFFDALISADSETIQIAVDAILAVGETSGLDALSGFVSVFRRWGDMKNVKSEFLLPESSN